MCCGDVGNDGAPGVEVYGLAGSADGVSLGPPRANENDDHRWYDSLWAPASEVATI